MKAVSKKQAKINNKLKKVYKEIAETRGHYCTGCGRSDVPLSHSHYIARSRRKDLETDPDNITYHCLSMGERKGCHQLWEGGIADKQKLLDYPKAMEYILENDTALYFLLTE
mgnify:FL=1|jgi:hypothetical protein|tara:strand:+ start:814 stop:1149 length:336 start_codon:yes stop_codon:yes gene_type:complete